MLVYDYIELREELFLLITEGIKPYKTDEHKSYYKVKGQTLYKITYDGLTQYFINSAHPV